MKRVIVATMLALAGPLYAEESARTVTAAGTAVLDVAPDEVAVTVGVETFAGSLSVARQSNLEACENLLKSVRGLGIRESDIATATLDVRPKDREPGHAAKGIEGYFVTRDYTLTLRQVGLFEAVVDNVLANGANRIAGFEFRTSKLPAYREEARKRAAMAARQNAEALAKALGTSLGPPRQIIEDAGEWRGTYAYNIRQTRGDDGVSAGSLPSGQIRIQARVTATFDLVVQ
jgi:uncharacterized protein YggE